jgi:hypothetical protein
MDTRSVVLLQSFLNLTSYAILASAFVFPRIRGRPLHEALTPFVALHLIRTLGLFALVPRMASEVIARSTWAAHVAIGDTVTVVLAMASVLALRARHRHAVALVWVMNVWGSLDVVHAGTNAIHERVLEQAGEQAMGAHLLVVAFGVPALVVSHACIFVLLLRARRPVPALR